MNETVNNFLNESSYWMVGMTLIGLFALLYFFLSVGFFLIIKWLLKKCWVQKITTSELFSSQIRFEIFHSLISIVVFGLYGLLIVLCYRSQIVSISFENNYTVLVDLFLLIIWNEIHFYICHRLMHSKFLIRAHRIHHRSVVVTPFSTYSFHPIESILLGTVMILPMFVLEFELLALVLFPIYHLFFNTLGHSNVKFIGKGSPATDAEISTQHNNHHTKYSSNFGFASPYVDRLLDTFYENKKE